MRTPTALLALAILACDPSQPLDPSLDPTPCESTDTGETSTDTDTGSETSGAGGTETGSASTPVPSCCSCIDGELDCTPANSPEECDAYAAALGTPSIPLDCVLVDGVIECPSIDCSPPEAACCSCVDGVSDCYIAADGCEPGESVLAGCSIDIVGTIDCGQVC